MAEKIVYYSEFGAVGDGVAEDFPAIVKCHEYANANGCKVMADKGARYYIGETGGISAIVKTDVDWQDATFIINDKVIDADSKSRTVNIFTVLHDYPMVKHGADSEIVKAINASGGIKADEIKNIGYAPGYPALLAVWDNDNTAYRRWGVHATGQPNPQVEVIVIDKDGNIDSSTPFLLNYVNVTHIEEYRIDDKPITITGGTFITDANCAPPKYTYYARGIGISRANVTIKNTVHDLIGEPIQESGLENGPKTGGAPYHAFIAWYYSYNLLIENVVFHGHRMYWEYTYDESGKAIRVHSGMGSYDIGGRCSTGITLLGCTQPDFYKDKEKNIAYCELERWGIMGSNYNKNITYEKCRLSRLDAHAGIYNVTIKDCEITYIKLIGGGRALIENTKVVCSERINMPFLELRGDYGSTWRGDIIIRNCEYLGVKENGGKYQEWKGNGVFIASVLWNNWPFGYKTYLPRIEIDNLFIDNPTDKVYVFDQMLKDTSEAIDMPVLNDGTKNENPMDISTVVTVKNNTRGYIFEGSSNPYANSKITIKEI